ncbi:MAG: ParB/RepB/Spo0J family partition protein [Deltaproteobacteria bacterium]|nr:ParB/RepB/Spo0J family partition protein [Deltaproteobacteria bacterium]
MEKHKKALGKGLSSLIPDPSVLDDDLAPPKTYFYCDIENVEPNREQPRKYFDPQKLQELSDSIQERGILQPVIVRRISEFKYEIIAGERRWRAAQKAGLKQIPVVVRETEGVIVLEEALIENIQREDLNPIEEAQAYQKLMDAYEYTQDRIAKKVGKDRTTVANALRLLQLSPKVRQWVIEGKLSAGHARTLLSLEDLAAQEKLASEIVERNLSVREIERRVKTGAPGQPKNAPEKDLFIQNLEAELSQRFKTKVSIHHRSKQGKIEISYLGEEDLNRIVSMLRS